MRRRLRLRVRRRLRRRVRAAGGAAAAGLALAAAGCGALPPQAPVAQASLISRALTTISAACGESYRAQAFNPHPDLSAERSMATGSAVRLARISRRHPQWVYQSKTLSQIDTLSVNLLKECSLAAAASPLTR